MYGTDKVALLCEAQSGEERGRASSANETTAKARNAQRKPFAAICQMSRLILAASNSLSIYTKPSLRKTIK